MKIEKEKDVGLFFTVFALFVFYYVYCCLMNLIFKGIKLLLGKPRSITKA